MNQYNKSAHKVYSLKAHIVLVTKYRYEILTPAFEDWLKKKIISIGDISGFKVIELKGDRNHIHILVDYPPNLKADKMISDIKQWTCKASYREWNDFMNSIYQGEKFLWSDGSFICSTGQGSEEVVANYIRNQGI